MHWVGIGVLVVMAFGVRAWLRTRLAVDIPSIHRIVPLGMIAFWCLIATTSARVWDSCLGILTTSFLAADQSWNLEKRLLRDSARVGCAKTASRRVV
jgi:hypothetical protein